MSWDPRSLLPFFLFLPQIWDRDIFKPNDAIAEANLNLRALFKKVYNSNTRASIPKQWVEMTHPNFQGPQGIVEMEIELLTAAEARADPAGRGRKPPNALEEPNRPPTSFAPWRVDKYVGQWWMKVCV